MIRIGFLYYGEPTDVKYWSGTVSRLFDILKRSEHLEVIKIIVNPYKISLLVYKAVRLFSCKKNELSFIYNILDSIRANRVIRESGCDLIFAPACSKLIYSGRKALKNKKLIYLSDATYHNLQGYYFKHSLHDQRIGNTWESTAHQLSSAIILPATWSRDDAINYYNTPEEKINIIKFGSNMEDYGHKIVKSGKSSYKLLLVGVDYVRKGVDVAIETVKLLNESGLPIKFELNIVGLDKPDIEIPEYVTFFGKLRKSKEAELNKLIGCYMENDIFILPTKAECSAIVYCEAAMFGLPCFTYATGGTRDYVEDGITGRCLNSKQGAHEFCRTIIESIESGKIEQFSINAREKYLKELNWSHWLEQFEEVVDKVSSIDEESVKK